MTTRSDSDDGDDLDEPQLRSMRAVWLSMRDEEPPAAGLAELLAAARTKAEAMRPREPWWQRALASLRRPPVLALATVVVLLGGAVAIGTRRDELTVRPEAASEGAVNSAEEAERRGDGMADGKLVAPAELAKDSDGDVPAAAANGAGAAAEPAPVTATGTVASAAGSASEPEPVRAPVAPPAVGTVGSAPVVRRPERQVAPRGAASGPGAGQDMLSKADVADERGEAKQVVTGAAKPAPDPAARPSPPPPPPPPPPADVRPQSGKRPQGGQRLQIADDAGGGASDQQPAPEATETTARAPVAPDAERPRALTAAQLVKQSETAAARGDCAAVRALAARLRKLDPAAHKAHVDGNAAVRRCLK